MLGVIETDEALRIAKDRGLDLIEVSPNARPPVCRIQDHGQLKYQQAKEEQKQKKRQKKIDVKGVRISMRISENDLKMKINQTQKFLDGGHKVRVELKMRGRERAHQDMARQLMRTFRGRLEGEILLEQPPKRERLGLGMVIAKKE